MATYERIAGAWARLIVALRFLVLPAWAAAAVASVLFLPDLGGGRPLELGGLIPDDADSIEAGRRANDLFTVPLTADTVVVHRDPGGLSLEQQEEAVRRAATATREDGGVEEIVFALPVLNTLELFPGSRESGTTSVTHLFFSPETNLASRVYLAQRYADQIDAGDGFVGVTGPAAARWRQFESIDDALPLVEGATVAVIAVVVGLTFRAFGAPLLALLASAVSFLVARGLIPTAGDALGTDVPQEVEPLVVALTLGIVTDYTIFFLSPARRRLAAGQSRLEAAVKTAASVTPIVATAGLIVVLGTAALVAGELDFFRAFGPALAITAAVAVAVSVTLVPAALALFGRAVFWPHLTPGDEPEVDEERPSPARLALARFATAPPVAALIALVCVGGLVAASTGLARTELAFRIITGLDPDSEVRQAATQAGEGFVAGILAPAVVLVEGPGVTQEREGLARLEASLEEQEGVAGVIGPGDVPLEGPQDVFLAAEGSAARYVLILEGSPLGSDAIGHLDLVEERLPALASAAGLSGVQASVIGQPAIASDTIAAVLSSLLQVGAVVIAVNLLLLALFLRAIVAPLFLLATSLLSVTATLGLTTYLFQGLLGHTDLTYYVPFAAGVLLVSLGSDYNVFVVGTIWQEARRRPMRDAVAVAVPRASRAISVAGIALAASFAMLALVPLDGFREFAFMMSVGVLVETFVVRSFLVPALVSLFGRTSHWPGRLRAAEPRLGTKA